MTQACVQFRKMPLDFDVISPPTFCSEHSHTKLMGKTMKNVVDTRCKREKPINYIEMNELCAQIRTCSCRKVEEREDSSVRHKSHSRVRRCCGSSSTLSFLTRHGDNIDSFSFY